MTTGADRWSLGHSVIAFLAIGDDYWASRAAVVNSLGSGKSSQ